MVSLSGCVERAPLPKLGISFGVGAAQRWTYEIQVMTEHARALGLDVDARMNRNEEARRQLADCEEMIDEGVDALIVVARDVASMKGIVRKARARGVKVIAYARAIHDAEYDFYVGYDTYRIGWSMGDTLVERVFRGDIAILQGDAHDINVPSLQDGAMRAIQPAVDDGDLRVILNEPIERWSPALAKARLKRAVARNGGRLDGVLAHNDILAGAAAEAVREMGLENHVSIVGMDAELSALRRLVRGEQDATVHMDLGSMAVAAVEVADDLIKGRPASANAEFRMPSGVSVNAYLVSGKIVTKENLDRLIVEPGVHGRQDIYGDQAPGESLTEDVDRLADDDEQGDQEAGAQQDDAGVAVAEAETDEHRDDPQDEEDQEQVAVKEHGVALDGG